MMTTGQAMVLGAAVLLSACATSSAPASSGPMLPASVSDSETGAIVRISPDSRTVSLPLDADLARVWTALSAVYAKLGIPTEIRDEAARSIGTRGYQQARLDGRRTMEWLRCGHEGTGPSSGGMYRTRVTIISTARSAGAGNTTLVTEISGVATRVEGTSTGAVTCASKGDLEQRIRELVLEELAR